jgi:hypothetical protein
MMVNSLLSFQHGFDLIANESDPIPGSYDGLRAPSAIVRPEFKTRTTTEAEQEEQLNMKRTYPGSCFFTGRSLSTKSSSSSLSFRVGNLRLRSAKASRFSHTACAC